MPYHLHTEAYQILSHTRKRKSTLTSSICISQLLADESAVREIVGRSTMDFAITEGRAQLASETKSSSSASSTVMRPASMYAPWRCKTRSRRRR